MRTARERQQRTRGILGGALMGLVVAGTLALPSVLPPAVADDEPFRTMLKTGKELLPRRVDGNAFVKPEWTVEPWVSTEAVSETIVRKIGYGRTEFVSVMTTDTGTYSSDGLASPHIRYPGIHRGAPAADAGSDLAYWDDGWVLFNPYGAGSFVTVPYKDGRVRITEDGACVRTQYGLYC